MHYVYIIRSVLNGHFYTGSTSEINRRMVEHNSNNTKSLKNKGPFVLVYSESYENKLQAHRREQTIKSYKGGNAFKRLIGLQIN